MRRILLSLRWLFLIVLSITIITSIVSANDPSAHAILFGAKNPVLSAAASNSNESPFSGTLMFRLSNLDREQYLNGITSHAAGTLEKNIRTSLSAFRYDEQSGAWNAVNYERHISIRATAAEGVLITHEKGSIGMLLAGIGRGENLQNVPAGTIRANSDRLEIVRGTDTEWYLNCNTGIEQGMTLASRPAGTGNLQIAFNLSGTLTPALERQTLVFSDRNGPVINYAGLAAYDATGRNLPVKIVLRGTQLSWEVDDRDAIYPLTIDPTLSPVAGFTADKTSGPAPLAVQFTDTTTNSPTGWAWFFGDENYTAPWTQVNASSGWTARYAHSSVTMPDGSVVLTGGTFGPDMNDTWRSTDYGTTWTLMNASSGWAQREFHTSVVMLDGSIVLMGGVGGSEMMSDTWRSTDYGTTWTQVNASSGWAGRAAHTSVAMSDGSIVLMGGYGWMGDYTYYFNDTWRSTDYGTTWTLMNASSGWAGRYAHTSVAMPDGSIVLMGGFREDYYLRDVWRSTDYGATWTQQTANAGWTARSDHTSVAMPDGSIVLMGGADSTGYTNDTWRSTDYGAMWTQVNASSGWTARSDHTSVAMPDGSIVLMGGYDDAEGLRNDTWQFQPTGSSTHNPSHTYTLPGTYQVALQAYNAGGYNSTRKAGYIRVPPIVTGITPSTGQNTTTISITNLAGTGFSGTPTVNLTKTGLSNITATEVTRVSSSQITCTFDLAGKTIGLWNVTVINPDNQEGSLVGGFTITNTTPAPVAGFSGSPTTGSAPLAVTFTDASTRMPTGWAWFFGDENYTAPWTQETANAEWTARHAHSSVAMSDGSIVLMGGSESGTRENDTWQSTDNGATWTQVNASSGWMVRSAHSSVAMPDGSIVLTAGWTGTGGSYYNDTWRSTDNGATWTQVNASSGWTARAWHSSVAMPDGSIVLMGGDVGSGVYKDDTWRSTDNGATWMQVNASAGWTPRYGQSSVVMPDSSIVLAGGDSSDDIYTNDTWRSTDNGATWTRVNASSGWMPRAYHSSVAMPDGSVVLMGGYDGSSYYNDVWQSTDNGATWTQVNASAGWAARAWHSSVAMPDGSVVLMGGVVGGGGNTNDVWRFVPTGSSLQSPPHTYTLLGIYQVALQAYNAGGYNSTRKAGYITVTGSPAPTVTGITPSTGVNTTTVPITNLAGTNFLSGASVNLTKTGESNITATGVTMVDSTNITCTFNLAGKTVGLWNVTVINPDGQQGSLVGGFTVTNTTPAPTVTGITPSTGVNTTTVPITNLAGTNFLSGAQVNLTKTGESNITATGVTVVDSTNITCTFNLAGKTVGLWNVNVTNPDGQQGSLVGGFTVTNTTSAPTVTGITPSSGQNTTTISITNLAGIGFSGTPTVNLTKTGQSNITATSVAVVDATNITCTFDLAGKAVGLWNVTVVNPDGQEGSKVGVFEVTNSTPAPTVTGITPATGQNISAISITNLVGTGFYGTPTVNLTKTGESNITATGLTVVDSTNITCTFDLAGKAVGLWNVTVINPDGQEGSKVSVFSITNITPAPAVTGITPATGQNISAISI
ncbi:MAG: hypothetical protein NTZ39_09520, partial [Methanoregula sp.]|nr:hypothetical protein [Methanoregula sp.]